MQLKNCSYITSELISPTNFYTCLLLRNNYCCHEVNYIKCKNLQTVEVLTNVHSQDRLSRSVKCLRWKMLMSSQTDVDLQLSKLILSISIFQNRNFVMLTWPLLVRNGQNMEDQVQLYLFKLLQGENCILFFQTKW